jgi:hypothetical protein
MCHFGMMNRNHRLPMDGQVTAFTLDNEQR